MVDVPVPNVKNGGQKLKWNVNAKPFVPSSAPSSNLRFLNSTAQTDAPVEFGNGTSLSYSAALQNLRPKPKPPAEPIPSVNLMTSTPITAATQQPPPSQRRNKPSKSTPLFEFLPVKLMPQKPKSKPVPNQDQAGPSAQIFDTPLKPRTSTAKKESQKVEKQTPPVGAVPRGNILDSSVPVLHKGKQREVEKKRYTRMKKVILNERKRGDGEQNVSEKVTAEDSSNKSFVLGSSSERGDGETSVREDTTDVSQNEPSMLGSFEISAEAPSMLGSFEMSNEAPSMLGSNPSSPESNDKPETPNNATGPSNSQKRRQGSRGLQVSKFCDNVLSEDLNQRVVAVIAELGRFQDRLHAKDPDKARMKKRIVYGLREVHKLLKVEKIRCVIFAPNIESAQGQGGPDEVLNEILTLCRDQNVPYFFALTKNKLGYVSHKHAPISCAGILNYQGADEQYKSMLETATQAKLRFTETIEVGIGEIAVSPSVESAKNVQD